jgi:hypothetical protein
MQRVSEPWPRQRARLPDSRIRPGLALRSLFVSAAASDNSAMVGLSIAAITTIEAAAEYHNSLAE